MRPNGGIIFAKLVATQRLNMNWIYIVISSFAMLLAQSAQQQFDKFSSGMSSGNASVVTSLSGDNMLLKIDGSERSYSKTQATSVLSDFFKKHPSKGFTLSHKSETDKNAMAFGEYQSDQRFKVSVQFVRNGNAYKLGRLAIE